MELRQLRHFLALVEERSITRAAKRELIVQSGLSNSIQALERELGTPLYVRGTRPVRLTAHRHLALRSASGAVRFLSRRVHSRSYRHRPAPAVRTRADDDLDGRDG